MNRLAFFLMAAFLGAGIFGLLHRYTYPPVESPEARTEKKNEGSTVESPVEPVVQGEGVKSSLIEAVAKSDGALAAVGLGLTSNRATPSAPTEDVPLVQVVREPVQPQKVADQPSPLEGASLEQLQLAAEEGRAALEAGDLDRGKERYRDIFRAVVDRRDEITVVPIVRKLVSLSPSKEARMEYLRYLAEMEREPRQVYVRSLEVAKSMLATAGKDNTRDAWSYLTRAYLAAKDGGQRRDVLAILNPFVERNLHSQRYSPLLKRHVVQVGESLDYVSKRYSTTIEAIKRLNRLSSDVIQRRQSLLILPGPMEIFVKKREFRLWALVGGKLLMEKPVGLGRFDSTPIGEFRIVERQKSPTWYRPGQVPVPPGDPKNILGSRWLGFEDTDEFSGFGIHGTQDASTVGKESSAGCIRMRNADVELLFDFTPWNTRVVVMD